MSIPRNSSRKIVESEVPTIVQSEPVPLDVTPIEEDAGSDDDNGSTDSDSE